MVLERKRVISIQDIFLYHLLGEDGYGMMKAKEFSLISLLRD